MAGNGRCPFRTESKRGTAGIRSVHGEINNGWERPVSVPYRVQKGNGWYPFRTESKRGTVSARSVHTSKERTRGARCLRFSPCLAGEVEGDGTSNGGVE